MAREITCYVYDKESIQHVTEYLVTIGPLAGYTSPTSGDMDGLELAIAGKLHKSEKSLLRVANGSPFNLYVDVSERGSVDRGEMGENLQEQADQYDADSVRHLR